ncbi:ribulose-phosphate 3-epimerase [Helicobacter aurati]|uniref:Ribulose-phosphate 3-epimerase n=1 Tax=Helicobacter aurati TaxID=137778 RepID=A0A3D8J0Y8_9HELI|nr:ribulose-phosphate 3-epimerase [Helicobacter aurati]RDU71033.1 ribulose-phosphate 3-epimerase [Helicobacter aurati]
MLVAPSLLAANFLRLEEEIKSVVEAGCDLLHVDVMDGHFVPNLTIGPCVLMEIPRLFNIPLDIHLMVENADTFIDLYAPLRPHFISVHVESERHLCRIIQKIRSYNISPAVALNPHTDPQTLKYILNDIDMVLVMSVNPGFGGQSFIESSIEKIVDLKELIIMKNANCLIEVDGGVNNHNIAMLKNVGVDIVVGGSYIFGHRDRKEAITSLKI